MAGKEQGTTTQTGFASTGYTDACPNFHLDGIQLQEVVTWPDSRLTSELGRYAKFLERNDVFAPQREKAEYNTSRARFEQDCRDGKYDYVIVAKEAIAAQKELQDFQAELAAL